MPVQGRYKSLKYLKVIRYSLFGPMYTPAGKPPPPPTHAFLPSLGGERGRNCGPPPAFSDDLNYLYDKRRRRSGPNFRRPSPNPREKSELFWLYVEEEIVKQEAQGRLDCRFDGRCYLRRKTARDRENGRLRVGVWFFRVEQTFGWRRRRKERSPPTPSSVAEEENKKQLPEKGNRVSPEYKVSDLSTATKKLNILYTTEPSLCQLFISPSVSFVERDNWRDVKNNNDVPCFFGLFSLFDLNPPGSL
ncbi:hypothetical protein GWI33_023401 [Rhynchophorus ferrugineus]|uniref:Uncharacterized protein n=1 Tax=Rhynchophorus ferrugineus TaxID=354439 RepID=A0A834MGX1_RHYFE|nr:hypothetical protein GWI33_023401 [Rhynchophorus ferrugineus]